MNMKIYTIGCLRVYFNSDKKNVLNMIKMVRVD
jgi:hypothetical protein